MQYTNKLNLPQPIVDAVKYDGHRRGDYSITELGRDPKELWLTRRHDDEIVVDVADRLWALMGSAIHFILEKADSGNTLIEEYLKTELNKITVTGRPDLMADGVISDYKFTSVWTLIFKSQIESWTKQLNGYAYLYHTYGFKVKSLEIIVLLRDWSKTKAKFDPDYPQLQIQKVPIELWTTEKQKIYLMSQTTLMEKWKDVPDKEIPICSEKNRWHKEDKFAVMKAGNKKASKVCSSETEAQKIIAGKEDKEKHTIEFRQGEDTKCLNYCDACTFCNHYKTM